MTGKFQVLIGGVVHTYRHIDDIPASFDNLIGFELTFLQNHIHKKTMI